MLSAGGRGHYRSLSVEVNLVQGRVTLHSCPSPCPSPSPTVYRSSVFQNRISDSDSDSDSKATKVYEIKNLFLSKNFSAGTADIKVTHKELRLSALDRAIRGKRYEDLVTFKPTREGIQEMIRTFAYLFHTPSSVIRLLAEEALQFETYAKAVLNHPIRSNLVSVELHLDTLYLVNELLTKVRAMDSALFTSFAELFIEHKGEATDSESKHGAYLIALHNAARKANKLLREGEELSTVHEQIRSSLEKDKQIYTSLKHCNDYFIRLQRGEGLAFPQLRTPKK